MSFQRPRPLKLEALEDRLTPVSFTSGPGYTAGNNGQAVATGDLNEDGRDDILFADAVGGVFSFLTDPTGNLTLADNVAIGDPRAAVLADLNGDGKLDLLVANGAGFQAVAAMGNGDGTFQPPTYSDIYGGSLGIAVADFDGDGRLDAAVANGGIAILSGTGTASVFAAPVQLSAGGDCESVTVGDFNNDGKPDIASGEYVTGVVDVFLNNGDGTFAAPVMYPLSWHGGGVATGDFDGNGRDDIVVSYGNIGAFVVLLANPDGTFQAPTEYGIPGNPAGFAIADFDLDGRLDLAVSDFGSSRAFVYTGNGDGTLAPPVQAPAGINPSGIAVGDFNNDGLPDLVSSNTTSPASVTIALNNTPMSLASFTVSAPPAATIGVPVAVTITARTTDGTPLANYTGTVHVTSTDGLAVLPVDVTFAPGDYGVKTILVTFNTVGDQTITGTDTLNSVSGVSDTVMVGAPVVASVTTLAPLSGPTVFGDVAEFVASVAQVAGHPVPTGTFSFFNATTGAFLGTVAVGAGGQATFHTTAIAVGTNTIRVDYSGDSHYLPSSASATQVVDRRNWIVVGSDVGPVATVQVFDPRTGARVQSIHPFNGYRLGVKVATGDVNNDGISDIIVAAKSGALGGHVKVYSGADYSELASFFTFVGYTGGVNIASGDVNGDGFADIIVGAAIASDHVKVFSGHNPADTLLSFFAYGGGNPVGVTVGAGDVNGDGLADVITGSATFGGHIKVFSGGLGQLIGSYFVYGAGYLGGVNVAAGDLDGDGRAEIIAGATNVSHVKVLAPNGSERASFFAYRTPNGLPAPVGVRVGVTDRDGDGLADILTGAGGIAPVVKVFSGLDPSQLIDSFVAAPPDQFPVLSGVFVGGSTN